MMAMQRTMTRRQRRVRAMKNSKPTFKALTMKLMNHNARMKTDLKMPPLIENLVNEKLTSIPPFGRKIRGRDVNLGRTRRYRGESRERKFVGTCGVECKRKCTANISPIQQRLINAQFWNEGSKEARWRFVLHHTTRSVKKRKTTDGNSRRNGTVSYRLPDNNDAQYVVCKQFFLKTLDISDNVVRKCSDQTAGMAPVLKG